MRRAIFTPNTMHFVTQSASSSSRSGADYPAWRKLVRRPATSTAAGELGFIGIQVPEKFGGGGEPTSPTT